MNKEQLDVIKLRIAAAKRLNKFFKDKVDVRAANSPFNLRRSDSEDILGGGRLLYGMKQRVTHASMFDLTASCHLGNCRELNSMAYFLLKTQQIILSPGNYVHLIMTLNFDHVFVAITDKQFLVGSFSLRSLGKTCLIYDKWTHDYYFPNISLLEQMRYRFNPIPNPYQFYVRNKIATNRMIVTDKIPDV